MQQAIGNRETRDGLSTIVQPKLTIGAADDPLEREADRTADAVLGSASPDVSIDGTAAGLKAQRMCAECAEEEEDDELVQPKALPGGAESRSTGGLPARLDRLRGTGDPLPPAARAFFEPRFGHDFSDVRVHTGPAAADTSRSINARAFTVGRDIVFGRGEYDPDRRAGRHLLAHELTHVVQQTPEPARRQPQPQIRREPQPGEAKAEMPVPGLIVDDEATAVGPGQLRKSLFLAQMRATVCRTAEDAFAGTEHTAKGCPWIEATLSFYESRSAERLERDLATYVPEAAGIAAAHDYLAHIATRARQSIDTWLRTGEVSDLAVDLPGSSLAGSLGASREAAPESTESAESVAFKEQSGGTRGTASPGAIASQLGSGSPLAGAVRSRMESAFGDRFSNVRVHHDATAARLSRRHHAKAFTVGQNIAFASGQYRPNTVQGDALIAHELAHTLQQRSRSSTTAAGTDSILETDANRSAFQVLSSLWSKGREGAADVLGQAGPRLSSGLRLQRCGDDDEAVPGEAEKQSAAEAEAAKAGEAEKAAQEKAAEEKAAREKAAQAAAAKEARKTKWRIFYKSEPEAESKARSIRKLGVEADAPFKDPGRKLWTFYYYPLSKDDAEAEAKVVEADLGKSYNVTVKEDKGVGSFHLSVAFDCPAGMPAKQGFELWPDCFKKEADAKAKKKKLDEAHIESLVEAAPVTATSGGKTYSLEAQFAIYYKPFKTQAEAQAAGEALSRLRPGSAEGMFQVEASAAESKDLKSFTFTTKTRCPAGFTDLGEFTITAYVLAQEDEFPEKPTVKDPCGLTGTFREKFLFQTAKHPRGVKMQGSGQSISGEIIHYRKVGGADCFEVLDCPRTASGTCATVGRTVAVDPAEIRHGTELLIEDVGPRTAEDSGGGIKGKHIDVYYGDTITMDQALRLSLGKKKVCRRNP